MVVLSWLDMVVVSICSMFFCHQCMGVLQSVTPRLLQSWTRSSQKWLFSKTTWSFCKQFSMMLLRIPEKIFWMVWGRNARFHFLTCFSPPRYLKPPSKCFSKKKKPTTIIASRDEKTYNAFLNLTRLVHSSSFPLADQHRIYHGSVSFFAVPAAQPDRPAAVYPGTRK